jgi:hypothetical protein
MALQKFFIMYFAYMNYIRNCPNCDKEIVYGSKSSRELAVKKNTNCLSCVSKIKNLGRKASEETRLKMSNARKGSKNSFFGKKHSIETKRKIGGKSLQRNSGAHFTGKHHSDECKKRMSEIRAAKIASGEIKLNGFGRKTLFFSLKNNCNFYADSMLEKFRMYQLDSEQTIKSWTKRHKIKIQYTTHDGENKNYVPDFLIEFEDGTKCLEEVKGGYDVNKLQKKQVLIEYCQQNNLSFNWIDQITVEKDYRKWLKINNQLE